MIFDGIEAKVWTENRSDAPRPLEDTVDFKKKKKKPRKPIKAYHFIKKEEPEISERQCLKRKGK